MKTITTLLLLYLLGSSTAWAETFKCVENGKTVYSDKKCADDALLISRPTPAAVRGSGKAPGPRTGTPSGPANPSAPHLQRP